MKTKKLYAVIFSFGILFSSIPYAQKKSTDLPKEVSTDWYKTATENLLQKEYNFFKTAKHNTYRTVNPKNHLGFFIGPDGFSVYDLKNINGQQPWNIDFTVVGAGRTETDCLLPGSFTVVEKTSTLIFCSRV